LIRERDVVEVWFSGCHSDIGGGRGSERSSEIAARWMLGEAREAHLRLNQAGDGFLAVESQDEKAVTNESRSLMWKAIDQKQRSRIRNDGRWPQLVDAKRGASPREPLKSVRDCTVWHHESVTDLSRFGEIPSKVKLRPRPTSRTPASGTVAI
jgi:hypothetical protein